MQKELIRHQNMLVIIGTGVMLFSIWSVVRSVMFLILNNQLAEILTELFADASKAAVNPIGLHLPLFAVLAIDLGLRLFVGHSARSMGRYGTRSHTCIAGTIVLIVIGAMSIFRILATFNLQRNLFDNVITLFIDVTSFVLLVELLVSAIWLKRLTRIENQAKEGA